MNARRYETLDGRAVPAESVEYQSLTDKRLAPDPETGRWVEVRKVEVRKKSPLQIVSGNGATNTDQEARIVPPPTNPMGVARELVGERYTHTDGRLVLRSHKGDFYRWDGTCWPEAEARAVRGAAYQWLEDAVYMKVKDGVPEPTPWDPTARKVNDLVDALKAIAHLDGTVEAPAWLEGGSWSAGEIVPVQNGLLHFPTRQLLDHTPDYWAHHSLPFDYDPDAPEPKRWLEFLGELWGDDHEAISTLQEIFGYLIGGDTRQQKILLPGGSQAVREGNHRSGTDRPPGEAQRGSSHARRYGNQLRAQSAY